MFYFLHSKTKEECITAYSFVRLGSYFLLPFPFAAAWAVDDGGGGQI